MIHLQYNTQDWNHALSRLPDGALIKLVDMVQTAVEVKAANPKLKVLLRHVNNEGYTWSLDWQANVNKARAEYLTYIDDTFAQYAHLVDYVEEPRNEYVADTMNDEEIAMRVMWARACAYVWKTEFKTRWPHIMVLIGSQPVGNNIPLGFAQAAKEFGAGISTHAYIHFGEPGIRDPLDFRFHSGRWNGDDAIFRANGIHVPIAITETGPYGSTWDGWRSPAVLSGDVQAYISAVRGWIRDVKGTVAYQEGRLIGFNLFTTIGGDDWEYYQTNQPELNALADMLKQEWTQVIPPPIPPPNPSGVNTYLWVESNDYASLHGINYSPALGLWKRILEDGYSPVHTEIPRAYEGKNYAVQQAFKQGQPNRLYIYTSGQPIRWTLQNQVPPPIPIVERPVGVDVSHHQGIMNWPKTWLLAYYAFIKATQRLNYVDPQFMINWRGAKDNGLLTGAYHYFLPQYDAVGQAEFFVSVVNATGLESDLPLVLDVEEQGNTPGFADMVLACLQRIFQLSGRKPLLYTSIYYAQGHLREITPAHCDLWIANWTTRPNPNMPNNWSDWTFWQYSNSGHGPTYGAQSPRIDLNKFNGTLEQLLEYA